MEKETSNELKPTLTQDTEPQAEETHVNGKISGPRTATKEQFEKAHRKTSGLHAPLFRRLAE